MADDNALDLTLGLHCGGGGSSVKGKIGSSSNTRSDEVDRGNKVIDKSKNFLEDGTQQHPVKIEENIFSNFHKDAVDVETSKNLKTGGLWVTNDCRSTSVEEGKISDVSQKSKSLFSEMSRQKKRETETHHPYMDKTKGSHISISTDEGSTAENEATVPVNLHKSSDSNDGKEVEHARSNGKHDVGEDGSSSHTESDLKGIDCPAIRPGITADLKFGACGSYPNLPWVSTTGSGPNGKKVSGVTYKYSPTQIRIVCACHGSHMSPEEFVQHAS